MVVIMGVIITVVIIMLSLIPGTGIKSIITIITETDLLQYRITGRRVIMEPDLQIGEGTELQLPLVLPPEHPIVRQPEQLIGPPRECPTTVHPLAQRIGLPHQIFLQDHQVAPGVAEVIVVAEECEAEVVEVEEDRQLYFFKPGTKKNG